MSDSTCLGDVNVKAVDSLFTGQIGFDLCNEDFTQIDTVISYPGLDLLIPAGTFSLSCIKDDDGEWYGFSKAPNMATLLRFDFGQSLDNFPTVTTVATSCVGFGLNTTSRGGIRFIKVNSVWYGLTTFSLSRLGIIKFTNGLSANSLVIDVIFSSTVTPSPADLDIEIVNDSIVVGILSQDGTIGFYNFGHSFGIPVYSAFTDVVDILDLSGGRAIEIVKWCDQYHVFITGITRRKLNHLFYGNSLFNLAPTYQVETTNLEYPVQMRYSMNGGKHQIWVKHRGLAMTKYTFPLDFSGLESSVNFDSPSYNLDGDGFELIDDNGVMKAMTITLDKFLMNVTFESSCTSNSDTIIWSDSINVSFNDTGTFWSSVVFKDTFDQVNYYPFQTYVHPSPEADFNFQKICEGDSTSFIDLTSSSATIINWNWDFGDLSNSTSQNPSHVYQDTGTYDVTLAVQDINGCSDQKTIPTTIYPLPQAHYVLGAPCQGQVINFYDSSYFYGGTLQDSSIWVVNNQDTFYNSILSQVFLDTGNNHISLISISDKGCVDSFDSVVNILPSPIVSIELGSTCFGDTLSFQNNTTSIDPYVSLWLFGDGDSSSSNSISHYYQDTGFYQLQYSATSGGICSDTFTENIRISQHPIAFIDLPDLNICSGEVNLFKDSSALYNDSIKISTWIINLDTLYGQDVWIETPSAASNVNLNHSIIVGTNCFASATSIIDIIPGIQSKFQMSNFCAGDSIHFNNISFVPTSQSIASKKWRFGESDSSELFDPIYLFPDTGIYTISLFQESDLGCISLSDTLIRIVNQPLVSFSLIDPLCSDNQLSFDHEIHIDPNDSIVSSYWTINNDTIPFSESLFTSAYGIDMNFQLIVETKSNCIKSYSGLYTINQSPKAEIFYDTVCAGLPVQFTDLYSGSNYYWKWTIDDQFIIESDDPTFSFLEAGIHKAALEITDISSSCLDTVSKLVAVSGMDSLSIVNKTRCADQLNELSINGSFEFDSLYQVNWSINDQALFGSKISTDLNFGINQISATVNSVYGCESTVSTTLEGTKIDSLTPNFTSDPENNLSLTFSVIQEGWMKKIQWLLDDQVISEEFIDSYVFEADGFYVLQIMVESNEGCVSTFDYIVNIGQIPIDLAILKFEYAADQDQKQFSTQLFNNSDVPIESFNLTLSGNSGLRIKEQHNIKIKPSESVDLLLNSLLVNDTSQFYCLEVSNINGIEILNGSSKCIPSESFESMSSLFPNPTEENVSFLYRTTEKTELFVEVLSVTGDFVFSKSFALGESLFNHKITLDLSSLDGGIYLIRVQEESSASSYVRTLIKL